MAEGPERRILAMTPGGRGGETVEWYTPPAIFDALGLSFDLDVASPGADVVPWTPAARHFTAHDNALWQRWEGRVWINPPYGSAIDDFAYRFADHRHGIALVYSRTETSWYQRILAVADALCLPSRRIAFVPGGGVEDGQRSTAGSTLFACGSDCVAALERSGLGPVWVPHG